MIIEGEWEVACVCKDKSLTLKEKKNEEIASTVRRTVSSAGLFDELLVDKGETGGDGNHENDTSIRRAGVKKRD